MLSDSTWAVGVLWAVLPLALTAMINAAELAAVYLDDAELRHLSTTGDQTAIRIIALLGRHEKVDLTVQLLTALGLFASGYGVWLLLPAHWGGEVYVAMAVITVLVFLSLGVVTPRQLAGYFPEQLAFSLFEPLRLVCLLLSPLVWLLEHLANLMIRFAGKNPLEPPHRVTEEEIRMLVDEGEERGAIEEMEKDMINNIFEFDDRDVSEVMTHRTEVAAVEVTETLDEAVRVSLETGYSRIPVYVEDIDSICGILYAKDLLKYLHNPDDFVISDEMRSPLYVPESSSCSDVFALFQREKTQLAVVVDEYGGTYGIVTMEDLLESIVGNMQDEYDNEKSLATKVEEGVYILDGSMGVSEFERLLGLRVPDDSEADTLGGFVTERLGGVPRMPEDPHSAVFGNVTLTVIHCDEKRIEKVRAVVKPTGK
ncbi:MAG: hemolysin family protein [Oscillospiraceae bacterium]